MPESIEYDVALSFAGENRDVAEKLTASLMHHGVRVFYDASETSTLWGQDLYQYLQRIYRDKATYCVVLISRDYVRKRWTNHELKQAQARAFEESKEYILPIRLDDTEVPGINDTTGYVDLRITSIAEVTRLLLAKLQSVPAARFTHVEMLTRVDGETMRDQ